MADVVISYAREDLDFVRRLADDLRAADREVWVDLEGIPPSAAWWQEICAAIDAAHAVVFVLSPDWVASEVGRQELEHATAAGKRIIPVVRREVPDEDVPAALAQRNWILWRAEDDPDAAAAALAEALDQDLEWLRAHTRLHVRAAEWAGNERHRSFLLRGRDLAAAEAWLARAEGREPPPTAPQVEYVLAGRQAATSTQRRVLVATGVVAVVLVAALVVAVVQRQEAREQARVSESRALAASSTAELTTDPELSVLLAREAYETEPTDEAARSLRDALSQSRVELLLDHGSTAITAVSLSHDGTRAVTGDEQGRVRLWDASDGRLVAELREGDRGGDPEEIQIRDLAFTPDDDQIVAGALDGVIEAWDTAGEQTAHLDVGGKILALDTDPSRPARVVVGTDDGTVALYELAGDEAVPVGTVDGLPFDVAFAPDGGGVAATAIGASGEGSVHAWNISPARSVLSVELGGGGTAVSFSPDGERLAVADSSRPAQVLDLSDGRRLATYTASIGTTNRLTFAPDGQRVALAMSDGTVRLWDTEYDDVTTVLRGHTEEVTSLAIDGSGRRILTGSQDGTSRLWNIGHDQEILEAGTGGAFVAPGTAALGAPAGDGVQLWDLGQGVRTTTLEPKGTERGVGVHDVVVSADGGTVVAALGAQVDVWDTEGGEPVAEFGLTADSDPLSSRRVAVSAAGEVVATAWDDFTIRRFDVGEGTFEDPVRTDGLVNDLDMSDDGRLVAVTVTGDVLLWAAGGSPGPEVDTEPVSRNAVEFSPDGTAVATGADDGRVQLWSATDATLVRTLRGSRADVLDLAYSPDGRTLAVGSGDGVVRVWATRTGALLQQFAPFGRFPVVTVDMADGDRILAGGLTWRVLHCITCVPDDRLVAVADDAVTRDFTVEERERYGLPPA